MLGVYPFSLRFYYFAIGFGNVPTLWYFFFFFFSFCYCIVVYVICTISINDKSPHNYLVKCLKEIKNVINCLLTTIISKFVTSKSKAVWFTGSNDHFGIFKLFLQYMLFQISNAVVYVMPFIIGQHQIFADINYMIDAVKQFVHSETIYLMKIQFFLIF